jgi:hypothetical protein
MAAHDPHTGAKNLCRFYYKPAYRRPTFLLVSASPVATTAHMVAHSRFYSPSLSFNLLQTINKENADSLVQAHKQTTRTKNHLASKFHRSQSRQGGVSQPGRL